VLMPVEVSEFSLVSAGSDRVGDRLGLSLADDLLPSSSAITLKVCARSAGVKMDNEHVSNEGLASSEDRCE